MKKIYRKKILSLTVSALMSSLVCQSVSVQASDIDIYANATAGKTTLFLMFDTSGSMGYGANYHTVKDANDASSLVQDYGICYWSNGSSSVGSETKNYSINGGTQQSYSVNYCDVSRDTYNGLNSIYKTRIANECSSTGTNTYRCYDRLSRLKIAIVSLLSSSDILDTVRIGLGQFSSPTGTSETSQDGVSGRVIYPVVPLTATNRQSLISAVTALQAYNGTPSAAAYGEAGAYMLGANTNGLTYSGYSYSVSNSKNGNNGYLAPLSSSDLTNTCNGQGIYFLTDGFANSSNTTATTNIMQRSVGTLTGTGLTGGASDAGWTQIGQFAKILRNNKNIKTAVVGFGSEFPNGANYVRDFPVTIGSRTVTRRFYDCSQLSSGDLQNTCNWGAKPNASLPNTVGGYGNGGFYSAQSTQDVIDSVKYFVDEVTPTFDAVTTGSPTLPQDALNPLRVLPYGYYASFIPTPQDSTQLWLGNLNKYRVLEGQLYSASTGTTKLFNTDGSLNSSAAGMWTDGVKGQLPLGITTGSVLQRKLYTNRKITSNVASEDKALNQITFTSDYLNTDPQRNYWLNLLGYNVSPTDTAALSTYINKTPDLRQLGATMHSTPILLTQSGTITSTLDTTTRQDYLLFGTTQGLLHVVDSTGQEVFAFVPNEMMDSTSQREAFRVTTASTAGSNNLFYGVDAPWAAYTQYVANADGSLTVGQSDRSTTDNIIKGKQWVYGGLRMGGRSYYSLDLGDINSPTLKFHINPKDSGSNITNSNGTTAVNALNYMGQSWSKPTIARVKFNGQSKLVMIVGGGYDTGYESPNYDPSIAKGAGIYMFDADNGSLLWWASANASSATDVQGAQAVTANSNLKYSVVSQINAIDRDGDGYVDNLYFGDLGGQAFRIDLNNATSTTTQKIDARVVRLTNQHVTGGASPRFYEMPSVSAQTDSSLGLFAAVALSSGNRSSPLSGAVSATGATQNNTTASTSANDGVFVIYDKDVGNINLYNSTYTLQTQDAELQPLNTNYANGVATTNGGWVYRYGNGAGEGVWKGMNGLYAIDSILYTNVYYRDGVGIGGSCGAGVKGDSYLYRFCLPTGKCDRFTSSINTNGSPDRVKLGAGIVGAGLGASNTGGNEVKSTITTTTDCTQAANKNNIECQSFSNSGNIKTLRWYENNR